MAQCQVLIPGIEVENCDLLGFKVNKSCGELLRNGHSSPSESL